MKAHCEQQSSPIRQTGFQFDGQTVKQTHRHSWKWRMKIPWMCSSSRRRCLPKREAATSSQNFVINQETFSFGKLQLGSRTPWPPHCTSLCSFVPRPYSFLEHKVPGVLRQHVAVFPFGWHQMEKGWKGSGSMKPPLSPLVARSLSPSLYSTGSYFALIVLTKELNNINPCTPSSVGECQCFSFITKPRTICKLPLCSCYM